MEGMNLCFLGAVSDPKISSQAKESLENIDILFVPVNTLGPSESYKLAVSLEPAVIIPMNYSDKSISAFIKESGSEKPESMEKLTIKKKDLEGKEGEVIVLQDQ